MKAAVLLFPGLNREGDAMRAIHPAIKRAKFLLAAAHWRSIMRETANIRKSREQSGRTWGDLDKRTYWRSYKYARMAVNAARHVA